MIEFEWQYQADGEGCSLLAKTPLPLSVLNAMAIIPLSRCSNCNCSVCINQFFSLLQMMPLCIFVSLFLRSVIEIVL